MGKLFSKGIKNKFTEDYTSENTKINCSKTIKLLRNNSFKIPTRLMNIAVTGSKGFIAKNLIYRLKFKNNVKINEVIDQHHTKIRKTIKQAQIIPFCRSE